MDDGDLLAIEESLAEVTDGSGGAGPEGKLLIVAVRPEPPPESRRASHLHTDGGRPTARGDPAVARARSALAAVRHRLRQEDGLALQVAVIVLGLVLTLGGVAVSAPATARSATPR